MLFDDLDKPVTKGDLWTAIAGLKIYDINEEAREKRDAEIQKDWEDCLQQQRNRHPRLNGLLDGTIDIDDEDEDYHYF